MIHQRRGKNLALWGLGLQTVALVAALSIWAWAGSVSALAGGMFFWPGLGSWLLVAVLFYCRQLERREALEAEELAGLDTRTGTIFDGETEARPAAARARLFFRWIVPAFTLLWAALHALMAMLMLGLLARKVALGMVSPGRAALPLLVVGFLGFLFSRYVTGMSRDAHWRLLRATGSYLLMCVLMLGAVILSLLMAAQGYNSVDLVVAYVIAGIQLILAAELLINFILELYRPRVPGREARPSFDSRLLGLIAEPERVGHSIAETLNYQFGFEVSRTWFYRLVSRALVPLLVFGVLVLLGISAVVIVPEGQQAVRLRQGRLDESGGVLGPGLHFKWPWPIDSVEHYETSRIHEILLGAGEERDEKLRAAEFVRGREISLWDQEHGHHEELDFLIAVPPKEGGPGGKEDAESETAPPVNIIKLGVLVQYRIDDLKKFALRYEDPHKLMQVIAYREMTRYCSSATLDSPVPGDKKGKYPEAIMTYGRQAAADVLKERIRKATGPGAGRGDLAVSITYVGLLTVHPPATAAEAYAKVIEAERLMEAKRYEAEAEANKVLIEVAGDAGTALRLALAIRTRQELKNLQQLRSDRGEFRRTLDEYFRVARDNVKTLSDELGQERQLGARPAGDIADKETLLQAHQQRLHGLQAIEASFKTDGKVDLAKRIGAADDRVRGLFGKVTGRSAALEAGAQASRWEKALSERARAGAFQRELLAYQASPTIYRVDRWLDVWDEVLPGIRKYVLGVDRDRVEVWLNWEQGTETIEGAMGAAFREADEK